MKKTRGGRMTAAKQRAAKKKGGKGRVAKRAAGRNIKDLRVNSGSMPDQNPNVVSVTSAAPKLPDGVVSPPHSLQASAAVDGCRVFTHYNGPTDQLSGLCAGIAILDPGASPHPPHEHPEEEFLIVSAGTGEIVCGGQTTQVGPGAMMYCAGGTLHGITNTGSTPMTFYWSKWLAKGA